MRIVSLVVALQLLGVTLGGPAGAQELIVKFDRVRNTVSVKATRADVYDVVQQLFSQAGAPQVDVERAVRGRITTNLEGVSRDSALATVLSQVDASYRVANGIYYVRSNRTGRNRDDRRDDRYPRGGDDSGAPTKPGEIPPTFSRRVDMYAQDRPIGEVIRLLAQSGGVTILIDRDIPGDLRLDVMAKNEVLWTVLQRIASSSHLKVDLTSPGNAILRPLPSFAAYYRGRRIGGSGETFACRNCRFNELKRGWRFCPMCGERIDR